MKTLIGITGQKYAGKDTTGNYISELTDYPLYSFAKPLKEFCKVYFNMSEEELNGSLKETQREFNIKSWKNLLVSTLNFYFPNFLESNYPDNNEGACDYFYRKVFLPYLLSENYEFQTAKLIISPREIMQRVGTNFFRNIESNFWLNQAELVLAKTESLIITDVRFDNEAQWVRDKKGIIVNIIRDSDRTDYHVSETGISREYIDLNLENNGTIEELKNGIEVLVEFNIIKTNTISVKDFM